MMRVFLFAGLIFLMGCVSIPGAQPAVCVPHWDAKFANRVGDAADALAMDSPLREALGQLADLRKALPRC